jgi:hypothetical protein
MEQGVAHGKKGKNGIAKEMTSGDKVKGFSKSFYGGNVL